MSKLLEAAKRVVFLADHNDAVMSDGDAITRLRAALAAEEQRLDYGQLPATREWLTEVLQLLEDDRWQVYEAEDIATKSMQVCVFYGKCVMMQRPTRWQVLALLEAMGAKQRPISST